MGVFSYIYRMIMTNDQMQELNYMGKLLQLFDETRDLVLHQDDVVTDTGTGVRMDKRLTKVAPIGTRRLLLTTNMNQPADKRGTIDIYVFEREDGSTAVEWYLMNPQQGSPVWTILPSTHGMLEYIVKQMGGTGTQKPTYAKGGLTTQGQWNMFTRFNPKSRVLQNLSTGNILSQKVVSVAPIKTLNYIFDFTVAGKKHRASHFVFARDDGKPRDSKTSTSSEMYFSSREAETLYLAEWDKFAQSGQVVVIE